MLPLYDRGIVLYSRGVTLEVEIFFTVFPRRGIDRILKRDKNTIPREFLNVVISRQIFFRARNLIFFGIRWRRK